VFPSSQTTLRKVKRRDRIARWVITLGGGLIIVSVLGILLLIVAKTIPLFLPATARVLAEIPADIVEKGGPVAALGVDLALDENSHEKWAAAYVLGEDGSLRFFDLLTGSPAGRLALADNGPGVPLLGTSSEKALLLRSSGTPGATAPGGKKTIRAVEESSPGLLTALWSDGSVSLVRVSAASRETPAGAEVPPFSVRTEATIPPENESPLWATARRLEDGAVACAALMPGDHASRGARIVVTRQTVRENLAGEEERHTERLVLTPDVPGSITAMALDSQAAVLYAGTDRGNLLWWRFRPDGQVLAQDIIPAFRDKRAITSLAVLLGDVTLVAGDAEGGVTNWFFMRSGEPQAGAPPVEKLRLVRSLEPHPVAIRRVAAALRKRFVLVTDRDGGVSLDYATSQRRLLSLDAGNPLEKVALSPRADAAVGLDRQGRLIAWRIVCPHPEVSWQTLWGDVFYEGYDKPEMVWQTTGGEEYEPKFCLVPLVFGTLKATFYAMLFAVPLALGAAAYVSHFTTPEFKAWIKPSVELMAAVPSVVLGFLVAQWLAPRIERGLMALVVSAVTIPAVCFVFLVLWRFARRSPKIERTARGREFLLMAPLVVAGIVLAAAVAGPLEHWCFGGNLRLWLAQNFNVRCDQRNTILIAFGLGFAVIPIIFSLAEDALTSVPHSMTAASMALGASRWQTLWRVVLPSASPGIFAAVMIGFGRAVGETMIVLMATGNTPILDWGPLVGMRTLSANIAVEFPEAPPDGTLYRILFLCGVILFVMTFVLNTAAELVRQRLRKRFGQFQ
jgi:phosphate transport system permease protein